MLTYCIYYITFTYNSGHIDIFFHTIELKNLEKYKVAGKTL